MTNLAVLLLALPYTPDRPQLTDVSAEAPQLKQAFNDARGKIRVLLIVSPG
jgi:hypothetical protein